MLLHPAHGMSPSMGLKGERFLALCDPIEVPQFQNKQTFSPQRLTYFIVDSLMGLVIHPVGGDRASLSLQFVRSRPG